MAKKITTYEQWKKLSWEQKCDIVDEIWLIDMRKGAGIRRSILDDFKKRYGDKIVKVEFFWHGLYNFDIFVTIKRNCKVRLPRKFDIFEIIKKYD